MCSGERELAIILARAEAALATRIFEVARVEALRAEGAYLRLVHGKDLD